MGSPKDHSHRCPIHWRHLHHRCRLRDVQRCAPVSIVETVAPENAAVTAVAAGAVVAADPAACAPLVPADADDDAVAEEVELDLGDSGDGDAESPATVCFEICVHRTP